ncbi:MAG: CAP domain-containing protein [Ruminiclostridium sp.]|nr:CAP domain-containing protein [Ruminiclostridium sp.]
MEEKKKNPVLKVIIIILGIIAVIALCILSSRFSWFGTAEGNSSQSSGNTSINSEVSNDEASGTEKPDENSSATEKPDTSKTETSTSGSSAEATGTPRSEEQSTPAPETEQTTTTTKPVTPDPETEQTTTTTTVTTTTTTTVTEAPKPLWNETECSKEMYITVSCYSRKEAVPGSATVSLLNYGTKVKVVATTNTSYSKLSDGSFVHNDYLSSSKPAETTTTTPPATTTTTTTKGQQSDTPSQLPSGFGEGITANPPSSCNALEIEVFNLINDIRVQNGVKKLKWDPTAYAAAKTRVKEIVTCWGHYRADGTRCYSVYGEGEEPFHIFSHIGENIASGQHTAKDVVDSWMNSSSHRKNILNPDFENIAIAFHEANDYYHYYWVQEFTTYK